MVDSFLSGWGDVQGVLILLALGVGAYTAIIGNIYAKLQRSHPKWTLFIPHPNWASFCGFIGLLIVQFLYAYNIFPINILLLTIPGWINVAFSTEKQPLKNKKKLVIPFLLPLVIPLILWLKN